MTSSSLLVAFFFLLSVIPLPLILRLATAGNGTRPWKNPPHQRETGYRLLAGMLALGAFIELLKFCLRCKGLPTEAFLVIQVAGMSVLGCSAAFWHNRAALDEAEIRAVREHQAFIKSGKDGAALAFSGKKEELDRLAALDEAGLL